MKLEKKDDIHSMIVTLNTNQTGMTTTFETIDSDVAKHLSIGIAAQDIQTARECSVDFSEVKTLRGKLMIKETQCCGHPAMTSWPNLDTAMLTMENGGARME